MQHLKSALCQIIFFRVFPDVKVAVLSVLHILSWAGSQNLAHVEIANLNGNFAAAKPKFGIFPGV